MESTKPPTLVARIATLTVALGALTGLVVHASLSAGCGRTSTGSPAASAEPPIPAATSSSARGATSAVPAPAGSHPFNIAFPATKAAPVFHPENEQPAAPDAGRGR